MHLPGHKDLWIKESPGFQPGSMKKSNPGEGSTVKAQNRVDSWKNQELDFERRKRKYTVSTTTETPNSRDWI